ncbi:MAG: BCCT family transporter [Butyricicoccus sp.]
MNNQSNNSKPSLVSMINMKVFVPGVICLLIFICAGVFFPTQFYNILDSIQSTFMSTSKWVYVLCAIMTSGVLIFLLFSKVGNIRFGGKHAKPSISTLAWVTISLTGSIAIGICFFGVAGPVNNFMNPPEFLGVTGGSPEAVVPAIGLCFLHYCIPPYFIVTFAGFAIGLLAYNGKRAFRASSTMYPLIGNKCDGILGTIVDIIMVLSLVIVGTNMGLSVIQLNAGLGNLLNIDTPNFELIIMVIYVVATIYFACSGLHAAMGKLSNVNAVFYCIVIAFVLLVGPTNRLILLGFESVTNFLWDFIPTVGFGDAVLQTGWQEGNTMYYYSWNAMPGLLAAFFYATMSYGRTLKEFVIVHCLVPSAFLVLWYVFIGGTAIFGVMDGSNLAEVIAEKGSGIATFAFLDTLPLSTITKWMFILMAIMTFVTWSDAIAVSFPQMFLKETAEDKAETKTPKSLIAGTAIFMGLLVFTLLYAGGYDAMELSITCWGLPSSILLILMAFAVIKFLAQREKYDITYQEEIGVSSTDTSSAEELSS